MRRLDFLVLLGGLAMAACNPLRDLQIVQCRQDTDCPSHYYCYNPSPDPNGSGVCEGRRVSLRSAAGTPVLSRIELGDRHSNTRGQDV